MVDLEQVTTPPDPGYVSLGSAEIRLRKGNQKAPSISALGYSGC